MNLDEFIEELRKLRNEQNKDYQVEHWTYEYWSDVEEIEQHDFKNDYREFHAIRIR